jgi:hypothetical protein
MRRLHLPTSTLNAEYTKSFSTALTLRVGRAWAGLGMQLVCQKHSHPVLSARACFAVPVLQLEQAVLESLQADTEGAGCS